MYLTGLGASTRPRTPQPSAPMGAVTVYPNTDTLAGVYALMRKAQAGSAFGAAAGNAFFFDPHGARISTPDGWNRALGSVLGMNATGLDYVFAKLAPHTGTTLSAAQYWAIMAPWLLSIGEETR